MTIRDASVVRVEAGGKPGRPAVVLRIVQSGDAAFAFVVFGTGTHRPERPRQAGVDHRSRDGTVLGLEKPTYFYPNNVLRVRVELLKDTGRGCPPELFARLSELVGYR